MSCVVVKNCWWNSGFSINGDGMKHMMLSQASQGVTFGYSSKLWTPECLGVDDRL